MANSNAEIFEKKMRKFIYSKLDIFLNRAAIAMVDYIESEDAIPVLTSNLRDSTGVGVYLDGTLRRYMPVQKAIEPSINQGLWGNDELSIAIMMAASTYSKGAYLVVFSAMPYAIEIDEKYSYFTGEIKDEILRIINGQ